MAVRALLLVVLAAPVLLAACSFAPRPASTVTDSPQGGGGDGNGGGGGGRDDAKVFDDAPAARSDAPDDGAPSGAELELTTTTLTKEDVDLTTEGTADWAHWGLSSKTSFDHKATGGLISNLATAPPANITGASVTASWSDGTPDEAASKTTTGIALNTGQSAAFTVPAGTTLHTLRIYAGVQGSSAMLAASLSDDSAPAVMTTLTSNLQIDCYTITYRAAGSATLDVDWSDTKDDNGAQKFTMLLSATLQ